MPDNQSGGEGGTVPDFSETLYLSASEGRTTCLVYRAGWQLQISKNSVKRERIPRVSEAKRLSDSDVAELSDSGKLRGLHRKCFPCGGREQKCTPDLCLLPLNFEN